MQARPSGAERSLDSRPRAHAFRAMPAGSSAKTKGARLVIWRLGLSPQPHPCGGLRRRL